MEKYYYSYDEFIEDTKILSTKIKEYSPDTLVSIARGGLTLGHFISSSLNIRRIFTINSIHYNEEEKLNTFDIFNIPDLSDAKKVVLIDDIIDSGETMNEIINILRKQYPKCEFKIATIFYKSTAIIKADFQVKEATKWIEFFWEIDV